IEDRHHIYLDIIPGEAHWQMNACEGAIKGVKEVMSKLADEDDQITPEDALATAILTFNQRDVIRGFSPMQLAFGCGRDATGRLTQEVQQLPEELQATNASGEFQALLKRQAIAEKAMVDWRIWRTKERLDRAQHSRPQPTRHYTPGDLVFYWLTQESGQGKRSQARNKDASWGQRGSSLPRQSGMHKEIYDLGAQSGAYKELVEAMVENDSIPWTFTRDIQRELPPTRRISMKRPGPSNRATSMAHPDAMEEDPPNVEEREPQRLRTSASPTSGEVASQHWTESLAEEAFLVHESPYWSEETAAVTVEVDVPTSKRGVQAMTRDMTHFFVG
ncbi:GIP, partial [Symbiodinium sp. CCMP2456]